MEDNLVLKVYRNEDDSSRLDIGIAKEVNGFELYRIALTLLNKILEMSVSQAEEKIDANLFLDTLAEDLEKVVKKVNKYG